MNQQYIFFWSLGSVWKLSLEAQETKRLRLYVSELELHTQIIMVRPVSKMNTVCIRVNQSPQMDCIIIWDLSKDIEIDSFDV